VTDLRQYETTRPKLRLVRSQVVRGGLGLVIVGAAFIWALPAFASYRQVWSHLGRLGPGAISALCLVGLANILSPSANQCAALPGLRFRDAVAADWTTSAITNTIPGGSALAIAQTWSMYRSYGIASRDTARCVVVTGAWDTIVKLGSPLIAVIWLSTERPVDASLIQAAALGAVLFAVVIGLGAVLLAGPSLARRLGHLLNRVRWLGARWPERLHELRTGTAGLLATRWRSLTLWTVAGHANLYLLLVLCLRAVGVASSQLSLAAILAAFAFGRLVTALPLSPGGLGVMEVGLTGALATVGPGADPAAVVAAVLLFRFATFFVPIPLGALCWLHWTVRRRRPEAVPAG
jgi:putative heme transporter